jgi:CO/xanthine dehydrogenase FAD-binding subunit
VGTRRAQAISKVCFAGAARVEDGRIADVRIALGSVAPTVIRCYETEEILKRDSLDTAKSALVGEIAPIDDIRSTLNYRRRVAVNLLAEFVAGLGRLRTTHLLE